MPDRTLLALGIGAGALAARERHLRREAERLAAATFESLLNAIEANDAQTGMHVRRVAAHALVLADAMGADEKLRRSIERVALFHDIGKIHEALFDIIHDDSTLSPADRRAIATHPRRGAEVLKPLGLFYPELPEGVLAHHERWDGSGYPRGLRGRRIPLTSRVVALADTFDAVSHDRRYRKGAGVSVAQKVIEEGRGTQFDPELVDLMLLPPVMERLTRARFDVPLHRAHHPEQRNHRPEPDAPDIRFRWRSESLHRDHPKDGVRRASSARSR